MSIQLSSSQQTSREEVLDVFLASLETARISHCGVRQFRCLVDSVILPVDQHYAVGSIRCSTLQLLCSDDW